LLGQQRAKSRHAARTGRLYSRLEFNSAQFAAWCVLTKIEAEHGEQAARFAPRG
jgi:hypothetical protein